MYRHYSHDHFCISPFTIFTLGVAVGFIGSEKIRFFHKMYKKHGHKCCSTQNQTDIKEEINLRTTNGSGTEELQ